MGRIGGLAVGLVGSLLFVVASCGGTHGTGPSTDVAPAGTIQPSPPPATATASASGVGSAGPAATSKDPKANTLASWMDDVAIQGLARDCHWDPDKCIAAIEAVAPSNLLGIPLDAEGVPPMEGVTRVAPACMNVMALACAALTDQSCVPDECAHTDEDCLPECDKTCTGCSSKCVTGCETCKSTCKDDACRLACGKSCAECHQACLKGLDHCATAECSAKAEKCFHDRDEVWNKSTCPKVCPKVQDCVEKCPDIPDDPTMMAKYQGPCAMKCLSRLGAGCPKQFQAICAGDPNASVAFNAYRAQHPK